jgi:putative aldouronate transport system permease protein
MRVKIGKLNRAKPFDYLNAFLMLVMMVVMVYPFLNTVAISFNDATDSIRGGIYFLPRVFTLYNYESLFVTDNLVHAFFVSVSRTVIVTVLNVFFSAMVAYILSRKEFILKKPFAFFLITTMYLSPGLIPIYFNYKDLGLINRYMVYIWPYMLSIFNMLVIRTYIYSLPESLAESARIDGAGDFRIFVQIIIPLCKPVLATVALWVAVEAWNNWFDTYIFASSKQELSTLQYEMMKLLSSSMVQSAAQNQGAVAAQQGARSTMLTPMSIRSAITIIAALPILFVYPFLQKYFVAGLHLGGVKG